MLLQGFAIELWRQPDLKSLCLSLQEQFHLNVNLVLFALWLEAHQLQLSAGSWSKAERVLNESSRDFLLNLRALRKQLKYEHSELACAQQLKQALLQAELELELRELALLQELADSEAVSGECDQLRQYLKQFDNIDAQQFAEQLRCCCK
ncbi:TIGR02444 family protein [Agaribacterium haliotis]|uniref:TIGR02444 family protein n=1 Tax=Agaribacterium haliotis TaxID=2013869 RepID=UPI000BB59FA2|nr:TIGR02444 family protein [Agaribacterium haliotis]